MKDLTKGHEGHNILNFAIPMLIGNIFQQLYNVVDSIVVGKYIGSVALAAVGASFPLIFTLSALIGGITIGASVLVSQYFGAKNFEKVKTTSDTLQIFLFVSSIVLVVIFYFLGEPLFKLLSIPAEVIPDAIVYFNIILISSIVPMFGMFGISAVLRGVGNSKTPIYFVAISIILNIILDLLFVLVFEWGVAGVAWATGISSLVAWIALWQYLNRGESTKQFATDLRKMEFDWSNFRLSLKIGLPSGIQQTLVGLGSMALLKIVSPFGVATLAAYTAAGRVDMFVSMPGMNLAAALSSFVGQNIGAKRYDRIYSGLNYTLIYSALISIILSLVVVFFGKEIMWLFAERNSIYFNEVIKIGKEYLIVVVSFYIIFTTMFVLNAVPRGAGATIVPMLITTMALWVIRIPLAYLLGRSYGPIGIWWSIPIGWSAGLLGSFVYYKSGLWKKHAIKM